MAEQIHKLTREQEVALEAYREKWTAIGLSTAPVIDRAGIERAANAIRAKAGLPWAPTIWCDGPASAVLLIRELQNRAGDNEYTPLRQSQNVLRESRGIFIPKIGQAFCQRLSILVKNLLGGHSVEAKIGSNLKKAIDDSPKDWDFDFTNSREFSVIEKRLWSIFEAVYKLRYRVNRDVAADSSIGRSVRENVFWDQYDKNNRLSSSIAGTRDYLQAVYGIVDDYSLIFEPINSALRADLAGRFNPIQSAIQSSLAANHMLTEQYQVRSFGYQLADHLSLDVMTLLAVESIAMQRLLLSSVEKREIHRNVADEIAEYARDFEVLTEQNWPWTAEHAFAAYVSLESKLEIFEDIQRRLGNNHYRSMKEYFNSVLEHEWRPALSSLLESHFYRDTMRRAMSPIARPTLISGIDQGFRQTSDTSFPPCFCGSLDSYWVAYYRFPHEHVRPIHSDDQWEHLENWTTMCRAGWWFPYENLNIITERASDIQRDEDGELHCEVGPAVTFRDGWRHWALHGVTVDEQIVLYPETQTLDQIRAEENEEVRRIRIERYGWPRYLDEMDAVVLDMRRNDIEGTDEALMESMDYRVLVCACPSTGRIYAMEVPPDVVDCAEAQAWLRNQDDGYCIGAS